MRVPVSLPVNGVTDSTNFVGMPDGFNAPTQMLNVWPFGTVDHPQIGTRSRVRKLFNTQLGNGLPGQDLLVVQRAPVVSGYRVVSTRSHAATGRTVDTRALDGQVWSLSQAFGMRWFGSIDPTGYDGSTIGSAPAVKTTPDGTKTVVATNYLSTVTGVQRALVVCFDNRTGEQLWEHPIVETDVARYVNHIEADNTRAYVCTNEYIRVIKLADGSQQGTDFDCNGWSHQTIKSMLSADGAYLFVAFEGSTVGVTLGSGVEVSEGVCAQHWRSGVMKLAIQDIALSTPLVIFPLSTQLASTDRYYEGPGTYAPHKYLRLSEQLPGGDASTPAAQRSPRGCLPTGLWIGTDGAIYVSHTNTGWGPSSNALHVYPTKPSNDYAPPNGPYRTVTKFSADGVFLWTRDTFSILEDGDGGFINDIPTSSGDDPSVHAIGVCSNGTVVVAGRRNSAIPGNVYYLDGNTGEILQAIDLGATIRQGALEIDKSDGNPILGGDRTTGWPGASGANAHIWKLDKENGAVLKTFDLGASVSCLGISTDSKGGIQYSSDTV